MVSFDRVGAASIFPYSPEAKPKHEEACGVDERQVEVTMDILSEGPEEFYKSYLD